MVSSRVLHGQGRLRSIEVLIIDGDFLAPWAATVRSPWMLLWLRCGWAGVREMSPPRTVRYLTRLHVASFMGVVFVGVAPHGSRADYWTLVSPGMRVW